jgi:hypothetical protein
LGNTTNSAGEEILCCLQRTALVLFNLGGSHLKFGGPAAGTDNGIEIRRGSVYPIEEAMNENNRTQDRILQLGEEKEKERRKKRS